MGRLELITVFGADRSNVSAVQNDPSALSARARTSAWRAMGLPTPTRRTGASRAPTAPGASTDFLGRQSVLSAGFFLFLGS
ncbi:BZ3500_MvSof-1268-A1-R1_Chr4-3g07401 [Microbotryum saponariae]|uniref:BZ3500_MvSof-1268-A1-R1_Chr4-3g07401 protein n=1 Tax=Microbotryum saponariae TaxID=289078 RepID=A0A2X0LJ38_9BASI|nr:BZ3500_MvSof-1268-A1-R1_Chr4-3g07401 [Microbotryum saponariae]SDA07064.1 BZ3501_MvSof-1269-A2-R1_Chr4-2g07110 [Microbotryum saponariae]